MSRLYPVMLRLDGQRCVVVGGGHVAARKAIRLVAAGASVHVLAPQVCDELDALAMRGDLVLERRRYQVGDLAGAALAFAATNSRETNAAVAQEAATLGIPVNVADDPSVSTFQVPATIDRGPLSLAISTSGRSPAFARWLREELESWLSPDRLALLELYAELRSSLLQQDRSPSGAAWAAVDGRALELLRAGRRDEARVVLEEQVVTAAGRES